MSSHTRVGLLLLTVSLVALPGRSSAADIACGGHITMTMADYPACSGNLAFKTDTTADAWMCAKSSAAGAVILTAMSTDKFVGVWIEGSDVANCALLPSYRQISYIILYP